MRTLSPSSHEPVRDWKLAVAAGFLALTLLGATVDRRSTFVDRSVASPRSVEPAVTPPTNRELVREMMTHD